MPLTAIINDELIDATLCSNDVWSMFYRKRPRVEIVCRGCAHSMHAKISSLGQPFFAHDKNQDCENTGESVEHLMLKRLFAESIRECGWIAELEATPTIGDIGGWRADVLAIDPNSSRRIAFEVQLSAMSFGEGKMRTDRYQQDGIETLWISSHRPSWMGHLLAVHVRTTGKTPNFVYSVNHGVMRFKEGKWSSSELRVERVVAGYLAGSLISHFAIDAGRGNHGFVLVPGGDIKESKSWLPRDSYLGVNSDGPLYKSALEATNRRFRIMDEIRSEWERGGWV